MSAVTPHRPITGIKVIVAKERLESYQAELREIDQELKASEDLNLVEENIELSHRRTDVLAKISELEAIIK